MVFVNREEELRDLRNLLAAKRSHLVLLYGRRRLGKTSLLLRLMEESGGLYFHIPDQAEAGIIHHLNERLHEQTGKRARYASIRDFLLELDSHGERLIVLDEAQRLFEAVDGSAALLQDAWDTHLKNRGVMLVLCGSVIGSLESLVDVKRPLYGRVTYNHLLGPFTYAGVRQFYPKLEETKRLERYAIFGATPHYHDITREQHRLTESIRRAFLTKNSPLREEPRVLFAIEFDKPDRYQEVLEAMGRGAQTLGEVAQYYGRRASDYTFYFQTLKERLQIVTDHEPIGGKKKRKRVRFTDPFFRFYYAFVYPNMDRIELGDENGVIQDIQAGLPDLVGRVWEDVCRQWMIRMQGQTHDGEAIRFHELGSWWDGPDELDVVALGKDTLYCGESKYRNKAIPKSDLESFTDRASRLQTATKNRHLRLFVWTKSALSRGAQAHAEEWGILVLRPQEIIRNLAN